MNKYFLVVVLLISLQTLKAQDEQVTLKLRHIEGIHGIDASAGLNKYGYQVSLGYAQYANQKLIARIVLNSEFGKIELSSYNSSIMFVGLNHTILKLKDRMFFNLGYGGLAGFETSSNEVLDKKTDTFSYGAFIEANSEIYIFNKLALLIEFKQIYDAGSNFGQFRYYANAGFRFYIY